MYYIYNDGGRAEAGFKGEAQDCGARAVAIAAERPYREVYDLINEVAKTERRKRKSNARTGVHRDTLDKVLAHYGFHWVPVMEVGSGATLTLRDGGLPPGRVVLRVARHFCASIDGVVYDTFDASRGDTRAVTVYGYWTKEITK